MKLGAPLLKACLFCGASPFLSFEYLCDVNVCFLKTVITFLIYGKFTNTTYAIVLWKCKNLYSSVQCYFCINNYYVQHRTSSALNLQKIWFFGNFVSLINLNRSWLAYNNSIITRFHQSAIEFTFILPLYLLCVPCTYVLIRVIRALTDALVCCVQSLEASEKAAHVQATTVTTITEQHHEDTKANQKTQQVSTTAGSANWSLSECECRHTSTLHLTYVFLARLFGI